MKKVKIKVSALMAATLAGAISMLGFSACKTKKVQTEEGEMKTVPGMKVMYGVPQNMYKVIGSVEGPDGKPVEGATVEVSEADGTPVQTVRTAYNGEYFTHYLNEGGNLKVVVRPGDDTLAADSTEVSGAKLLANPSEQINFKLRKK